MARVVEPLRQAGAHIDARDGGRLPPLAISPVASLSGIEHRPSVASAQVKSALLLSGLFADGPTRVVEVAPTRDHTERLLGRWARMWRLGRPSRSHQPERLRCVDVDVPGDFSSAAFWLVLGVLHPSAEVTIENVGLNPTRTGLLTILQRMGANVERQNERTWLANRSPTWWPGPASSAARASTVIWCRWPSTKSHWSGCLGCLPRVRPWSRRDRAAGQGVGPTRGRRRRTFGPGR